MSDFDQIPPDFAEFYRIWKELQHSDVLHFNGVQYANQLLSQNWSRCRSDS
jgi:hypothetical protein